MAGGAGGGGGRAPQPCYPGLLQGFTYSGQGVSSSVGLELADRMMKAGLAREQREQWGPVLPHPLGKPKQPLQAKLLLCSSYG